MIDSAKEAKLKEVNARYFGMSEAEMIDNAGKALSKEITKLIITPRTVKKKDLVKVSVVCGLGNNGADGMSLAKHLVNDKSLIPKINLDVYLIGRKQDLKTAEALEIFKTLKKLSTGSSSKLNLIQDAYANDIPQSDFVVEALLGVGFSGILRKRFKDVINKIARMKAYKIAVDLPTPGYKADKIFSLISAKRKTAQVLDIDLPKEVEEYVGPGHVQLLSKPKKNSYKSQNGELLIFGGSELFHGAPIMAIRGASKFVGSVFFYTNPENRELIKKQKLEVQEFISLKDSDLEKYANYANVILVGPGLEDNYTNKAILTQMLNDFPDKIFVLDAYAIALANPEKNPHNKRGYKNCILTPHRGELRHIFDDAKSKGLEGKLHRFCMNNKCDLVLKGSVDLIFSQKGNIKLNKTGNSGMAKGGTGDVLSGMIAALATINEPVDALMAGTFLNGLAGDMCKEELGYNYSATDVIRKLQEAYKWSLEY